MMVMMLLLMVDLFLLLLSLSRPSIWYRLIIDIAVGTQVVVEKIFILSALVVLLA